MNKDAEYFKKMGELFQRGADIMNRCAVLAEKENEEDIEEAEKLMGKFMLLMIELEAMK